MKRPRSKKEDQFRENLRLAKQLWTNAIRKTQAEGLKKLTMRYLGYDAELFGRDEVDEKALVGLRGTIKVSRALVNGHAFVNLDSFAPAETWEELPVASGTSSDGEGERHDL